MSVDRALTIPSLVPSAIIAGGIALATAAVNWGQFQTKTTTLETRLDRLAERFATHIESSGHAVVMERLRVIDNRLDALEGPPHPLKRPSVVPREWTFDPL